MTSTELFLRPELVEGYVHHATISWGRRQWDFEGRYWLIRYWIATEASQGPTAVFDASSDRGSQAAGKKKGTEKEKRKESL